MSMTTPTHAQKYAAEFIGTAFLLATVVGSGIMAERLAGGNVAIALLGNTLPTGAILAVLINMLGPVSGAHFNPAVTLVFRLRGDISTPAATFYVLSQIAGGLLGAFLAHVMFELPVVQLSETVRTGTGQWTGEFIATFGLVFTILATLKSWPSAVGAAVGLYIAAAYWFTSSTSFANPAVTIARSFSNTFSGIDPANMPLFILFQLLGGYAALLVCNWLFADNKQT